MIHQEPTPLVRRMLLRDQEGVLWRVVHADPLEHEVWLFDVENGLWPEPMRKEAVTDPTLFAVELSDPFQEIYVPHNRLTGSDEVHEGRWQHIASLVDGENGRLILWPRSRSRLILARTQAAGVSRTAIAKWLRLYWRGGMIYSALRPQLHKCGAPGKRRNALGAKVGRARTISPGTGLNVNDAMRPIMRVAAQWYLKRSQPTLQEAVDRVERLFFADISAGAEGERATVTLPADLLTPRQLRYFISKEYPKSYVAQRRRGQKNWDLQERAITGLADGDVQGPGDLYFIDATIADDYLVSQIGDGSIVGRPVIYFVVDAFSRLIVGMYVGFEGPSWTGAMMALVNVTTPKVEYCKQFDIKIHPDEWAAHHASQRLEADRGELASTRLGAEIPKLGWTIENAPPSRADLKAVVERDFGAVPTRYRQFSAGHVLRDYKERGAPDYRLRATVNLHDFTGLVILAVLEHNAEPIAGWKAIPGMVEEGLPPTPNDIWDWGLRNRSGSLRILSIDEVALAVMPRAKARVTPKGISFKDGTYSCGTAIREDWFATARRKAWSIEVAYDPRNLGHIYVIEPKLPSGFEPCNLLPASPARLGISVTEVDAFDLAAKRVAAKDQMSRMADRIARDLQQEAIAQKAEKAIESVLDPAMPKSQRVAGIRENHAREKELQRYQEAFVLSDGSAAESLPGPPPDSPPHSHPASTSPDSIRELLRAERNLRKARRNG